MTPTKKQTYGGLPVSDEYLARYRVSSDQDVYWAIAFILVVCATLMVLASLALWALS